MNEPQQKGMSLFRQPLATAESVYAGWMNEILEVTKAATLVYTDDDESAEEETITTTSDKEKQELKLMLEAWIELLEETEPASVHELVQAADNKVVLLTEEIKKSTRAAVEETKLLETTYRSVALFFDQAGEAPVKYLAFLNVGISQLKDLDNTHFIDAVQKELRDNFDRLDLVNNYSLLLITGYLGSAKVLDKWARIVHDSKVMLVTDFENLDEADDVMEFFDTAELTGPEPFRSNVIMTCNWIVGRGRHRAIAEEDHLFLPPSAALAGKLYTTVMSQVSAGRKFGTINGADSTKFSLKKNEIAGLEKLGLIPLVQEQNNVVAFSSRTLFNGENMGLQTYSVVRVFDYVIKVLIDYLNRKSFENFNSNTRKELIGEIIRFLDSVTGAGKLIEDFTIRRFEQDPVKKDRVYLDIHLKPYFPAKTFLIKLEGQNKEDRQDETEWESTYEQA